MYEPPDQFLITGFSPLCAGLCLMLTCQQAAVVCKNSLLENNTFEIFKLSSPKEKKNLS